MALGLSSLGRLESRVPPTLAAVRAALAAIADQPQMPAADSEDFFAGERRLAARASQLFGAPQPARQAALLVTCPATAAEDARFMRGLAKW